MTIPYVPRKKVDKSGEEPKELYYAVPKNLQKRGQGIDERQLSEELADRSSLSAGDVLSTLEQIPGKILDHLKNGRTVTIKGLGTFYLSLKSEGVKKREDCKPSTIRSVRICFRADKNLKYELNDCEFENLEALLTNNYQNSETK